MITKAGITGPSQPRNCADRTTLAEEVEDFGAGFSVELVHGSTI
jgi:hypothetical protein